ncbi:MAG: glycosyl transferase [Candidatus Cloacimonetes bacterium]|nr:glycosyl transferase [Candidatus Cloacimonadota bacterium]
MKRLLLISYYFPPCGGAGVQRWLRFIRYLPKYGWMPTVVTTSEGDYPVFDSSLCKKIPDEVKVIRTKTPAFNQIFKMIKSDKDDNYPYGSLRTSKEDSFLKKSLYWMRINMVVPDSRVVWNKIAFNTALDEIRKKRYDLVVTTGPPHSTHLVGLEIKKKILINWIADFRDPWTKIYYLQDLPQNKILHKINQNFEKTVLEKADLSLIISNSIADSLPAGNKQVLSNGYDPEDYFNTDIISSSFFRIKYVGKLTEGQDIKKPLNWLNEISKERKIGNIEFSFVGTLSGVAKYERDFPYLHIRSIGYLNHLRAISEMSNADILILLINKCSDNKGILTSKLFEYIGSKTFIIGIGPTDGEAAEILEKYNAGKMVEYDDREGFVNIVTELYKKWNKRTNIKNSTEISKLSAPNQTKELSEILEQISLNKKWK